MKTSLLRLTLIIVSLGILGSFSVAESTEFHGTLNLELTPNARLYTEKFLETSSNLRVV